MKKLIHKTFFITKFTLSTVLQLTIALIALVAISLLAFIIDPSFPQNNTGTDMLSAYGYVLWMSRYFPHVPFWYPLQGAGVSFMAGYQWLSFMIVLTVHQLTKIPIFPIFNTLRFISFPATAFGIFAFCWTRLNYPRQAYIRQIIGIIGAIFYLIAPTTWYWSYKWGFYAESVSIMFIMPAVIFIDWFIDLSFKGDTSIKKRIALIGGLLFYILAFLTHFGAGFSITHIIPLMILARTLYTLRRQKLAAFSVGFKTGLIFFLLFACTFAWRLVPYLDYTHQSKLGGYAGDLFVKEVSSEPNRPTLKQMAQLEYLYQPDYRFIFNEFSLPLSLWILAGVGVIFGPLRSQKLFYLGICTAFALFAYTYVEDLSFVYIRSLWTLFRIVIPLVAAYGAFMVSDILLFILDKLFKFTPQKINFVWQEIIRPVPAATLTIATVIFVIYQIEVLNNAIITTLPKRDTMILKSKPEDSPVFRIANNRQTDLRNIWSKPEPVPNEKITDPELRSRYNYYDPVHLELSCNANIKDDPEFNNICDEFIVSKAILSQSTLAKIVTTCSRYTRDQIQTSQHWCSNFYMPLTYQLEKRNWPELKFTDPETPVINPGTDTFFQHIPQEPLKTRFDLSAKTGSMIMQSPLLTDVSQSQVYVHELNLFAALWNYQSSVMYADQPINQKPGVISEIAKYFGYEYILAITNSDVALNQYKTDPNWENIVLKDTKTQTENKDWWRFKSPTTLTSWTNKPAILFIADEKHYLYDQAFKTANLGVIPYNDALVFGGTEFVDDYSLEQLQQFTMLYLEGYKYHNEDKARKMLDTYVKNGGNLFIDTGWQFNNPDWQLTNTPAFFPSAAYYWKEVGPSAHMMIDDGAMINYTAEAKDLGPLTIPPSPAWGISTPKEIRSGAHVLLQTQNNPLVVAQSYGKGKVVWSGMNSIMHIEGGQNKNLSEIDFITQTIKWLLNSQPNTYKDLNVDVTRKNPDEIKFALKDNTSEYTTLYFRESYYPLWNASIQSNNKNTDLRVFYAGPRFMGVRIPPAKANDIVTLRIKTSLKYASLNALAVTTVIFLFLYLIGIVKPEKLRPDFMKTKQKMAELREDMSVKVHEDPNEQLAEDAETSL